MEREHVVDEAAGAAQGFAARFEIGAEELEVIDAPAGTERLPGAGQHDCPRSGVSCHHRPQRCVLVVELLAEGIHLLGVVEGHDPHRAHFVDPEIVERVARRSTHDVWTPPDTPRRAKRSPILRSCRRSPTATVICDRSVGKQRPSGATSSRGDRCDGREQGRSDHRCDDRYRTGGGLNVRSPRCARRRSRASYRTGQ